MVARVSAKTPANHKRAFTLSSELQYGAATFQNLRRRVAKSDPRLCPKTEPQHCRLRYDYVILQIEAIHIGHIPVTD